MARPRHSSFTWPGRNRSDEIERAADLAAERGLERLRERQRRRRAPIPSEESAWSVILQPRTPPPAPAEPREETEAPVPDLWEELESRGGSAEVKARPVLPGHLWEAEFDALADELVNELRRDLGPAYDRPVE